jgi:hypothetical protein
MSFNGLHDVMPQKIKLSISLCLICEETYSTTDTEYRGLLAITAASYSRGERIENLQAVTKYEG